MENGGHCSSDVRGSKADTDGITIMCVDLLELGLLPCEISNSGVGAVSMSDIKEIVYPKMFIIYSHSHRRPTCLPFICGT